MEQISNSWNGLLCHWTQCPVSWVTVSFTVITNLAKIVLMICLYMPMSEKN